jgi:adenylate kinase
VQSLQKQGSVLEELQKQFCNTAEYNTTAAKQQQQRHCVNGNHAIRALHQQQQNQQTNKQTKKLEEWQSAQDVIISNHEIKKAP